MTNDKPVVVWFQAITCNGNTHSLLSANASRLEQFLNSFRSEERRVGKEC